MKTSSIQIASGLMAALALSIAPTYGQNLLSDPGFESGTPVGSGVGGWSTFNGAAFSQNYARSGTWSMLDNGPSVYTVPGSYEKLAATPGLSFTLSGFGFTPSAISGTGDGFLQISFFDSSGNDLGTVQTGGSGALASSVHIDSSSTPGTWIPMSVTATAPANTAFVQPFTLVLDPTPTAVYFDDLTFTQVPEPSIWALMSFGLLSLPLCFRRRKTC